MSSRDAQGYVRVYNSYNLYIADVGKARIVGQQSWYLPSKYQLQLMHLSAYMLASWQTYFLTYRMSYLLPHRLPYRLTYRLTYLLKCMRMSFLTPASRPHLHDPGRSSIRIIIGPLRRKNAYPGIERRSSITFTKSASTYDSKGISRSLGLFDAKFALGNGEFFI